MRASVAVRGSDRMPIRIRHVLLIGLFALAVVAAAAFFWPPGLTASAGACEEVTSSDCRPFVELLSARADVRSSEIRSIDGLPHCGAPLCQQTFGGSLVRLEITYHDGATAVFTCYKVTFGEASCDPVADSR